MTISLSLSLSARTIDAVSRARLPYKDDVDKEKKTGVSPSSSPSSSSSLLLLLFDASAISSVCYRPISPLESNRCRYRTAVFDLANTL